MFETKDPLRIAVYGSENKTKGRGVGLWNTGYQGTLVAAGADPVFLQPAAGDEPWDEILDGYKGVVVNGFDQSTPASSAISSRSAYGAENIAFRC